MAEKKHEEKDAQHKSDGEHPGGYDSPTALLKPFVFLMVGVLIILLVGFVLDFAG